jgi:hypothetical protein
MIYSSPFFLARVNDLYGPYVIYFVLMRSNSTGIGLINFKDEGPDYDKFYNISPLKLFKDV